MSQIKVLQEEMADFQSKTGEITGSQMEMFLSLAENYNNAVVGESNLNVNDYIQGGTVTTNFEAAQDAVGNYQVNYILELIWSEVP